MSKKHTKPREKKILEQILSEDYWEGYYALADGNVVKCTDTDGEIASFQIFSISNGKQICDGTFKFREDQILENLSSEIFSTYGSRIVLRLSNEAENPDRHEEIDGIIASGESFELVRIKNLIRYLKTKSISIFGGAIGGQELSEGEYEGFYLMADGTILYCRDNCNWDENKTDRIVDGVVSYFEFRPERFSFGAAAEKYFGYLLGDRFSEFAEELVRSHGRVIAVLARDGEELFTHLMKALDGDAESAAIASHRLKLNICIKA